ncbi:hypothetical protein NXV06_06665 [Bacteroides fragilis]|uniref:hypothetical protein n=2 Tax=Bacteroides TaxID=816 RepID=UPI0004D93B6B|nr:hypothetical protein [Bacteroides fragilis]MBV4152522.1 hypothetical protein [Bacteroides fragilis]MCE8578099.1 hypothetical protein [Bacteroides fragilis]MCE8650765.1 hypothetical protein [Bacteroides fragilis]MCS3145607.1 hypothetical protein [Bacteroides fragilis]
MIMNERHCKWLPTIVGVVTEFVIVLFSLGYLCPIEKGTSKGGLIGAIGVCIILIISFSILILIRFFRKK